MEGMGAGADSQLGEPVARKLGTYRAMRARKIMGILGLASGGRTSISAFRWRTLVPLASLYLLLFLGVAVNAQGVELDIPSMAPEGESVLPENTAFAAECLLPWNDLITKSGWVLGTLLVTQSERWGEILRVDFKIPGEDLSPFDQSADLLAYTGREFAIERCYRTESVATWQTEPALVGQPPCLAPSLLPYHRAVSQKRQAVRKNKNKAMHEPSTT
jgi:hypothetical protein